MFNTTSTEVQRKTYNFQNQFPIHGINDLYSWPSLYEME